MNKIDQLFAALALGLLSAPIVAQAQGYDYETIDFPGASDTQVFGVNERGDAAGNGFVDPDNYPFVYDTKNGRFTSVAPVAGFDDTVVLGINDGGALAGSVFSLATGIESGLILDKNGTATVFDHPDAFTFTQARAMNSRGLVTGFYDLNDPLSALGGFIYDPKTETFTNIVPSVFTIPQGINARGDVVGSAIFLPDDDPCPGGFARYGWLRTTDGNVTYFTVNGQRTSGRGITDSGTIAGFITDPFTGDTKGYVADLDGTQCQDIAIADADLLVLPGAIATFAQGITNSGKVVGFFFDDFFAHGFVATPQ